MRQEPIIVKGHKRDKLELIKIASAITKKRFRIEGNIDVIKVGDYDQELEGHICVVEFAFVCKGASPVRGGYYNNE
jgi:hypothetical protein